MKKIALFLVLVVLSPISGYSASYEIDPDHSSVSFKVKHLFTKIHGSFNEFSGSFKFDDEKHQAEDIQVQIQANSLDTRNQQRDTHVKSEDFLDVKKFPVITFKSTDIGDMNMMSGKIKIKGLLNLHGIEKEVEMTAQVLGIYEDEFLRKIIGVTATTTIQRQDFAIVWNQVLDTGDLVLGDEVEIEIDIKGREVEEFDIV